MSAERNETRGRRVSIDLTPSAAVEVDRLRDVTQLNTADVFRYALHLFRIYVEERRQGKSLYTARTDNPGESLTRIELPLTVAVVSGGAIESESAQAQ